MTFLITTLKLDNGIATTPYQLIQWKHAMRLELCGVMVAKRKVSAHVRKVLGLKRSVKIEELILIVEDLLLQAEKVLSINNEGVQP